MCPGFRAVWLVEIKSCLVTGTTSRSHSQTGHREVSMISFDFSCLVLEKNNSGDYYTINF